MQKCEIKHAAHCDHSLVTLEFQINEKYLEFNSSWTFLVKTCRAEKHGFTVALALVADGTKLPQKVSFKGFQTLRDLVILNSLRVSFHKKGWMDESGMKEWIRQCLQRTRNHKQSLLVWDSFQAHLTYDVQAALKQQKINVAVIPGGLTPVLQPLDKCLNKLYKDSIRRKYLARLHLVCHFFVLTTFWRHLWSITEQTHKSRKILIFCNMQP